ncbi:unnamed protein product [Adineta steineri]|uniref:Potassium channel domain-containing protein n=1 Tax=Adineta steineri TaxID=433720 RepID=A0A815PU81_9BILA|nr:unnamed protein product [Adineta steineri]CAF4140104.1 unnamed protein product [Adineta steineri]
MPTDRATNLVERTHVDGNVRQKSFYRSFIQFLFSNLGLVITICAYTIGGAFLFQLLEQYIELQNCQQGALTENISITNISETVYNYIAISDDNVTTMYQTIVDYVTNFTSDIYVRRNDLRYTGQDCETTSGWNFPSALLFTITVVTTIGYGHITPVSWEGQITCICYALIGIPIFLLCLSNISSVLGDIFRFLYSGLLHCCCCVCRVYTRARRRRIRELRDAQIRNPGGINYTGTASMDPSWPETSRTQDGGYGDDDEDEDDYDIFDRMEGRVPFGAVILIIIGYICLGAVMFNKFEGWTMTESVYFCYITLSTIGFGDYVPGITSSSTSGLRFLLACLYILFGLAILAMCFDLIKEGIVDKFRWFANKLGIIADEDNQVDEDTTKYANFEYDTSNEQQTQPGSRPTSGKRAQGKAKLSESFSEPPAYEYDAADGQWMTNIRDKNERTGGIGNKNGIKMNNDKH